MASIAARAAGDPLAGEALLAQARDVVAGLDDFPAQVSLLQAEAFAGLFVGDLATVVAASQEGARLSRAAGDRYSLAMMLLNQGLAALGTGAVAEAGPPLLEALGIARRIDDRIAQYCLLDALACRAAGSGEPVLAAKLLGAAETVQRGAGAQLLPFLAPLLEAAAGRAVAALGAAAFEQARGEGRRLPRPEALRLALGQPPAAQPAPESPLGPREAQVAALIAEGLSNRQIAARLFVSEHTVDSHVRAIMAKLGFGSRARIAAWVASTG
jgi:DNA-binding CsgD family transcriptional regulator